MIQKEFAHKAASILASDDNVAGLAVGGSWLTNEMDEYSDLDLIIVTKEKVSDDKDKMLEYASRLDGFLSGFTGEHVGEPRLLICLYENPLLHVDIKFVTINEFQLRVENPVIILDKNGQLEDVILNSEPQYPFPGYQWIEDRFWIWIHYALLKIGRGEYFEAYDFLGFIRMVVLGPLLHIKNGKLPRGVRKVESEIDSEDLTQLKLTLPDYDKLSLLESLRNTVSLYRHLRSALFDREVVLQTATEHQVMAYFEEVGKRN